MSVEATIEKDVKKVLALVGLAGQQTVQVVTVIGEGAQALNELMVPGTEISPATKTELSNVVQKGEALATAVTAAKSQGAGNWLSDVNAVAAVEAFVPSIVDLLKQLKSGSAAAAAK